MLPKKADTFANRLIAHFVSYFTNICHCEIVIIDKTDAEADAIDLNSDRQMKSQVSADDASKDRPDVTLFDLGLGFKSDDHSQPITIVEFKRPKRDDYALAGNPITQVRSYVKQLRAAQKR